MLFRGDGTSSCRHNNCNVPLNLRVKERQGQYFADIDGGLSDKLEGFLWRGWSLVGSLRHPYNTVMLLHFCSGATSHFGFSFTVMDSVLPMVCSTLWALPRDKEHMSSSSRSNYLSLIFHDVCQAMVYSSLCCIRRQWRH